MEAMLEAGLEWLVVGLVVGEGEEEEEGWGPQLYRVVHSCFIPVISAIGIVGSAGLGLFYCMASGRTIDPAI